MPWRSPPETDEGEGEPDLHLVISPEGVVRIVNVHEGVPLVFEDKVPLERLLTEVVAKVMAPGYEPGSEEVDDAHESG